MPALSYRRRAYRRDLRARPKKFVWTVVGPITYQKEGSLTASAVVSGTSQAIFATRSFPPRYPYPMLMRRRKRR